MTRPGAVEPVASRPAPGREADNGVSEILAVNDHQVLVVERAGVENADGIYTNHVRVYEMETRGATDIASIPALAGAAYVPARKRLLLDLERIGLTRVDNIEGISWGPRLANGRRSLSAAHSGHLQIHENRIEGQGAGLLDRLAPVRSLCDLKA